MIIVRKRCVTLVLCVITALGGCSIQAINPSNPIVRTPSRTATDTVKKAPDSTTAGISHVTQNNTAEPVTPNNTAETVTGNNVTPNTSPRSTLRNKTLTDSSSPQSKPTSEPLPRLNIRKPRQTGYLQSALLNEISGLSASTRYPGLLYVINDSGNPARLHAIDETGRLLAQWDVDAENRDWEDLTQLQIGTQHFLVIGDTGDNLRIHKTARLHLLREPTWPTDTRTLTPEHTISYRYEDGPRNVEAVAAIGSTLYLISKEPVTAAGFTPHRVYQLNIPDDPDTWNKSTILTAKFIGTMPLRATGLEAKLAAALAGIDLTHPTAMAFNAAGNTAYMLTYREVLRIQRKPTQSWAEAFSEKATRLMSHNLAQAEALTLSAGRAIWFTSENRGAPLWAIPLLPPL